MNLILIEGLPGSGKSTMAEMLCDAALDDGIASSWYLEQSKDHHVHPIDFKHDKYSKDFPERCLKRWGSFVSANKDNDHLFIFEGSLFQSTVRFMLEGNNKEHISEYYNECQSILSKLSSKLIYLRPTDVGSHIDWTMKHRGDEWTGKVTEYLEKTPYCADRQWQGENCMKSYWSDYAQLCDLLVVQTRMPCHRIKAGFGGFESQFNEAIIISNQKIGLTTCRNLALKSAGLRPLLLSVVEYEVRCQLRIG
ncbi:MAG: hypothetical protein V7707_19580 [Motiliproteus sp.]